MAILNSSVYVLLPDFDALPDIEYCVENRDEGSGVRGTFAYDSYMAAQGLGTWAIGPVFDNVDEFFRWAKEKGFAYHSCTADFVLLREFPV